PTYAAALADAVEAGVEVLAYGVTVEWQQGVPVAARLARVLPVRG
ncbi:MAG: DNA/RNA nuclease SfsA, partial [Pseudomonadota bacterium]|nr:DNA/RNA nuclease SfsA [Pseudomonadota bacterium]